MGNLIIEKDRSWFGSRPDANVKLLCNNRQVLEKFKVHNIPTWSLVLKNEAVELILEGDHPGFFASLIGKKTYQGICKKNEKVFAKAHIDGKYCIFSPFSEPVNDVAIKLSAWSPEVFLGERKCPIDMNGNKGELKVASETFQKFPHYDLFLIALSFGFFRWLY